MGTPLLELGRTGQSLSLSASTRSVPGDTPLVELAFDVKAHPFVGRFTDVVMLEDLEFFRDNVARLTVPGGVVFGGGRMAELRLDLEPQAGGAQGGIAVEVTILPNGDQWPRLSYLIFDVQPFHQDLADALARFVEFCRRSAEGRS